MFAVTTVINPPPPVKFEYLPKMNACRIPFKGEGDVVIVMSCDPTVGISVTSNKMQNPIPMILFFIVVISFLIQGFVVCYSMDSYLNVCS